MAFGAGECLGEGWVPKRPATLRLTRDPCFALRRMSACMVQWMWQDSADGAHLAVGQQGCWQAAQQRAGGQQRHGWGAAGGGGCGAGAQQEQQVLLGGVACRAVVHRCQHRLRAHEDTVTDMALATAGTAWSKQRQNGPCRWLSRPPHEPRSCRSGAARPYGPLALWTRPIRSVTVTVTSAPMSFSAQLRVPPGPATHVRHIP